MHRLYIHTKSSPFQCRTKRHFIINIDAYITICLKCYTNLHNIPKGYRNMISPLSWLVIISVEIHYGYLICTD